MMAFDRPLPASHHCRHYSYERGMNYSGPKCAAGIDLSEAGSTAPCMPDLARPACPWRQEHTEAERAAWEEWRRQRAVRTAIVMAEIPGSSIDKKNKPEWGKSGAFACPACTEGTVRWVRAASNGHLHAACTTPGCFGVME
jgi:hypothetical protein